jgi:hypothetical protein
MASSRNSGPTGSAQFFPWEQANDDGTLCRRPSPRPGALRGPTLRKANCPFDVPCHVAEPDQGVFSELMVIEGKEWTKFLVSVGANAASPIRDTIKDVYPALKKLGVTGKASIRVIKGKEYVVIAGYPGLRKLLNAPKYLATNVKVADLVIGTTQLGKSAIQGIPFSVVIVGAADVLESILDDKELLRVELGFTILTSISKATLGSIAGIIAGAVVSVAGAPVVWPIVAGIVVGIYVGNKLDEVYPTEKIARALTDYYNKLNESIVSRGARALQQLEREILWRVWPHHVTPFPY